jgi:hypothetical protein
MTALLVFLFFGAVLVAVVYNARQPGNAWLGAIRGFVIGFTVWLGLVAFVMLLRLAVIFSG